MTPASSRSTAPCRCCGAGGLRVFHEVAETPVHVCRLHANAADARTAACGALQLAFCHACGFVQNQAFDATRIDYAESYEDSQAFSPHFREFAERLADRLIADHGLAGGSAFEIGCGKGDFLTLLCERGMGSGLGMDPAWQPGRLASPAADKLRFRREIWGPQHGPIETDLVCCRHTLEHLPEPRAFVASVREALVGNPEAIVFFEVPDLRRVLEEGAFWDLYYEHCSYFSLGSLGRLFRAQGFDLLRLAADFGDQYLVLDARLARGAPGVPGPAEQDLDALATAVEQFAERVPAQRAAWQTRFDRLRRDGRHAVLWGAGSKAVGFLSLLETGVEIAGVVDINPHKQGMHLPASGLPILAPADLEKAAPELVVVMNPVYEAEIRADLRARGVEAEVASV